MNSETPKLAFLSRRAHAAGKIGLVLYNEQRWDSRDSGWQLLEGTETGLELADPGNSLLISVERALLLAPKLRQLFEDDTPQASCAFQWDADAGVYVSVPLPADIPTQ